MRKRMRKNESEQKNGEKREIVYSNYSSQKVTDALDFLLDSRDAYLYGTIFKGCKRGFVRGKETGAWKDGELNYRINWNLLLCLLLGIMGVYFILRGYDVTLKDLGMREWQIFTVIMLFSVEGLCWAAYKKIEWKYIVPIFSHSKEKIYFLGEKERRSKSRLKQVIRCIFDGSKWHAVLWIGGIWYLIMGSLFQVLYYLAFGYVENHQIFLFCDIPYAIIAFGISYAVYKCFLGRIRFSLCNDITEEMVLWEDRQDHREHFWTQAIFFGWLNRRMILRNLEQGTNFTTIKYDLKNLLKLACMLSRLRCLCLLSEEIKQYVGEHSEYHITTEILEDDNCREETVNGTYTIILTGEAIGMQDTIIPTKAETKTRTFTLPYLIGEEMVRKFRETGCLDLSVLDGQFAAAGKAFKTIKRDMRSDLIRCKNSMDSKIIQDLDRKDVFMK